MPSHSFMTHTKTSITIIPRYSNILVLAYPIHHLYHFIPSTLVPMTPNFNQCTHFLHQSPTDTQHALNHDKRTLYTVTDVAWRPASRRQAVHQFWVFPEFSSTRSPTSFLPLRTLIARNSNTITVPTIQYLITMTHYSHIPNSQYPLSNHKY